MLLFCRKVASHYAGLCIEDVRKGCGAVQAEVDRRRERGDSLAREPTMHEAHTLCMDMGMCGKLGMYGRG